MGIRAIEPPVAFNTLAARLVHAAMGATDHGLCRPFNGRSILSWRPQLAPHPQNDHADHQQQKNFSHESHLVRWAPRIADAEAKPESMPFSEGPRTCRSMAAKRSSFPNENAPKVSGHFQELVGRGERIRTSDSCVPNAVLYQAELRPDRGASRCQ